MNEGTLLMGTILGLGGLFIALLAWRNLVPDPVGRRLQRHRVAVGLQGRQAAWLESLAPMDKPKTADLAADHAGLLTRPSQRLFQALVQREARLTNKPPVEALQALTQRAPPGRSRYFLKGQMGAAIRAHGRTLYHGPDGLFLPWYYLVALIRWGRRHLYLDMLAAVVEDLR